jgi:hypothetical protein
VIVIVQWRWSAVFQDAAIAASNFPVRASISNSGVTEVG